MQNCSVDRAQHAIKGMQAASPRGVCRLRSFDLRPGLHMTSTKPVFNK